MWKCLNFTILSKMAVTGNEMMKGEGALPGEFPKLPTELTLPVIDSGQDELADLEPNEESDQLNICDLAFEFASDGGDPWGIDGKPRSKQKLEVGDCPKEELRINTCWFDPSEAGTVGTLVFWQLITGTRLKAFSNICW